MSNAALSVGEDVLAVGLTWSALHFAIVAGSVVAVLVVCGAVAMWFAATVSRRLFVKRQRVQRIT